MILVPRSGAIHADPYDEDTICDWVCHKPQCVPLKPHIHAEGRVEVVRPGDWYVHVGDGGVIVSGAALRALAWVQYD